MEIAIKELSKSTGRLDITLRGLMYQDLEAIAGVSLNSRLIRRRARMKDNGASYKECQAVTKLDIISYDKKLRPIFESIVKKYQAANVMEQLTIIEDGEGLQ